MTSATFKFSPQPDIAQLFAWTEQLRGTLTYGMGKARIDFEVNTAYDDFSGETTEQWVEFCEYQVNDFVREYCPGLDSGDVVCDLTIKAESAPDDVQEQEDCERWSRAAGGRYAGRN